MTRSSLSRTNDCGIALTNEKIAFGSSMTVSWSDIQFPAIAFEIFRFLDFIIVINTLDTFFISLPIHILHSIAYHLGVFCFILIGQITLNVMYQTVVITLPAINKRFLNNNNNTLFDNMSKTRQRIINFITEHNTYCSALDDYNRFWNKLFFAFLVIMFPCCFVTQHVVLFTKINTVLYIFGIASTIIIMVFFCLAFGCAYMSKHIHRTAVPLSRLQWRLKGIRYRLFKLKLMTYFERLSSNRRIGVTLGPTITLTIPIFSQVNIKCNTSLIHHYYCFKVIKYK